MTIKPVNQKFDLEERTATFGESVIYFCKTVKGSSITNSLIDQIVRSSTSVGANYMEANGGTSRKDFKYKIHICKKESQETLHWLRMLGAALPDRKNELRALWQEAHELVLIFQRISSSMKS